MMTLHVPAFARCSAAFWWLQAVDPPTQGVPLRQLLLLQLDAAASGIAVHFCGNSQVRTAAMFYIAWLTEYHTLTTFCIGVVILRSKRKHASAEKKSRQSTSTPALACISVSLMTDHVFSHVCCSRWPVLTA
jgi:hypothetical protein